MGVEIRVPYSCHIPACLIQEEEEEEEAIVRALKITTSNNGFHFTSLLFISFQLLSSISQATVPASERFTYVNGGDLGVYIVEYDADYRALPAFRNPFQLCFYNTTPNQFTLALPRINNGCLVNLMCSIISVHVS
ncbi:hypothetical protein OSB04_008503 [Centaurea solstitialis]|uniref:Uncharacterized protein n=1 Tax=Centaurea solstitialis TaxID=347529 RepID=A0AA38TUG5_9ASTR|nr:hypothetical protein OSB04_008503 [Centaurea solstitialis]